VPLFLITASNRTAQLMDQSPDLTHHYWIVEEHKSDPVKIHHVVLPLTPPISRFNQLRSLNAFRQNMQLAMSKHVDKFGYGKWPDVSFRIRNRFDWKHEMGPRAHRDGSPMTPIYEGVPIVEAGDIKQFFAAVGYEPKKRKFITPKVEHAPEVGDVATACPPSDRA
jgi:hypothetical protein